MNSQRTLGAASLLVLSLAILGCAPPFLASELQVLTDLQAPSVQVTSPANGSTFQSIVTITGQIRDLDATGTIRASVATEFISEASYSVRDTELAAVIEIGEDGIFSFSFPSASFDKKIAVDIVAVDTNGNSSSFTLELVPDEAGPYLDVISPDDYTYYATLIELAGVVANTSAMESVSEVDTLEYRVLGTSLSGPLSFDDAGAYNTIIDSSTLTDNIVIEVKATDLNGYTSAVLVNQLKSAGGSDVAAFTVTPGNGSVDFSWDEVTGATSYTLIDYTYGSVREGVPNPYTWNALENGDLYSFQLLATVPGGTDAQSAIVDAIPLSPRTLAPWFTSNQFGALTLRWPLYESVDRYRVERSTDGLTWQTRRTTTGDTLVETDLDPDDWYWYRVVPNEQTSIVSEGVAVRTDRFGNYPVVGSLPVASSMEDVARYGDYLYGAGNSNGLHIFDVSDPAAPVLLGTQTFPESAYVSAVAVSGSRLYVGGQYHLHVLDLSVNPASPASLGNVDLTGGEYAPLFDVQVSGNTAFLAARGHGLKVVDVTTPAFMSYWTADTAGDARDVAVDTVDSKYVYVADYDQGVQVIDTTDQVTPVKATITTSAGSLPRRAHGVVAIGTQLYIAYGDEGLVTCDVSTQTVPGPTTAFINGSEYAYGVDGNDDYLFVAFASAGVRVYDIGTPAAPAVITDINTYLASDVIVDGNYCFVADYENLQIILSAVPDDPQIVEDFSGWAEAVAVQGDYAITVYSSSLYVYNISDPLDAEQIGSVSGLSSVEDVFVAGDHAYAARAGSGLTIVDISDKENPVLRGTLDTDGQVRDVVVRGKYAYVADGTTAAQFVVVDISDPDNPVIAATAEPSGGVKYAIDVEGDYAYLGGYNGFRVIDISDPELPEYLATADENIGTYTQDIDVSGNYAYIANDHPTNGGLVIYDVTDPTNPSFVIAVALPGDAHAIEVVGRYAYVTTENPDELFVVDVTVPGSPQVLATMALPADGLDISVAGDYAYVAAYTSGVQGVLLIANE